ncbi:MAG: type 4a pilus biogenesis protein PilO [Clostridia bacterium]|nr:type 4a pilus biogenesis protein PilO [Clostridia bacterium]
MNLEQLKKTMLISTAAFLVIVIVLVFAIITELRQWQSLQSDIVVAEAQLGELEQRLQRLYLLREQEEELVKQLEMINNEIPDYIDEQELIREFQKTALTTGCQISEFRFKDLVHQDRYKEIPFNLALEGQFAGLMELLNSVNKTAKLYRIHELSFQSSPGDGVIRADLEMSSFYID